MSQNHAKTTVTIFGDFGLKNLYGACFPFVASFGML